MTALGRVLVVDDEPELMEVLREALAQRGWEARGLTSGAEALALLRAEEFDILLSDLMMPGMDGIHLLRQAMALDSSLAGVIMTGQGTVESAIEAMQQGAYDYILKPFKLQALVPILERAMELRLLRAENFQLRDADAIHQLSQAIALTLDVHAIVEKTTDGALTQIHGDEASVMLLLAEDDSRLKVAAVRGTGRDGLLGRTVPVAGSISGWVSQNHEPLSLTGPADPARFSAFSPRDDLGAAVSVPMLAGGKLVGVLNVSAYRRRQFPAGQIKALSVLANTAASAIQNGRLYATLADNEAQFRALTEYSSDAVVVLDTRQVIRYASPGLKSVLGFDPPASLGQPAGLFFHPDDRVEAAAQFRASRRRPGSVQRGEFRLRHADGSWRWVESSLRSMLEVPGVRGFGLIFTTSPSANAPATRWWPAKSSTASWWRWRRTAWCCSTGSGACWMPTPARARFPATARPSCCG